MGLQTVILLRYLLTTFLCLMPSAALPWWQSVAQQSAGSTPYVGPRDVVGSGADAWWGLRGYSAAYSTGSNPAADVCDAATVLTCVTANILTTGAMDVSGLGTVCAVACVIKKLYDQTGNGHHLDVPQNAGVFPALALNDNGSLPAIIPATTNATDRLISTNNSSDMPQPYSVTSVARRTTFTGNQREITVIDGRASQISFANVANTIEMYGGGLDTFASGATDGTTHAIQGLFSNAASKICIDGSSTTVNIGNAQSTNTAPFRFPSSPLIGKVWEAGWWPADLSSVCSALSANQHSYWNF